MLIARHKLYILALFPIFVSNAYSATEINFTGALIAEPCLIEEGDEAKELDFGTVIDRDIYTRQKSKNMPVTIVLTRCSADVAKTVTITFNGNENSMLPGFLAINSGSNATGIAIGMETLSGQQILINKTSPPVTLEAGRTLILLNAFIQGEPNAVRDYSISSGYFSATATFSLNYQ